MLKLVRKNLDTYKQMVKKSLLVLYFKIFAKKEKLRLDILDYIYIKKMI